MVRDINQLSVVSCQLPVETNCHHEERSDVVTKYIKDKKMTKKVMLFLLLNLLLCLMLAATGREEALFEQPVLITSAGQSAEVQLASVLAKRAGLASTLKKTATADDLEGQKTLILVVGVSMKGLGAAGLDAAEEKERIQKLISKSQESSIPILCLHLGGEARRGELTDGFIQDFLPSSQKTIVVKSGNKDGLFTKICEKNNIPMIEVERTPDAVEPLKNSFK